MGLEAGGGGVESRSGGVGEEIRVAGREEEAVDWAEAMVTILARRRGSRRAMMVITAASAN